MIFTKHACIDEANQQWLLSKKWQRMKWNDASNLHYLIFPIGQADLSTVAENWILVTVQYSLLDCSIIKDKVYNANDSEGM